MHRQSRILRLCFVTSSAARFAHGRCWQACNCAYDCHSVILRLRLRPTAPCAILAASIAFSLLAVRGAEATTSKTSHFRSWHNATSIGVLCSHRRIGSVMICRNRVIGLRSTIMHLRLSTSFEASTKIAACMAPEKLHPCQKQKPANRLPCSRLGFDYY